jgi:1,2-diacylglycerol 3-alpha-glucosyltransferase
MKVCHVCLCGPVTDNFSYQENLLTKYQAKLGMDVSMIASPYYFTQEGTIAISDKKEYVNSDGVKLYRLKVKKGDYEDKFRRYDGLYETIERINPDVLFVHGVQFLDLTLTFPSSSSLSPATSMYGIFSTCASLIL